jgi:hypothetical protein
VWSIRIKCEANGPAMASQASIRSEIFRSLYGASAARALVDASALRHHSEGRQLLQLEHGGTDLPGEQPEEVIGLLILDVACYSQLLEPAAELGNLAAGE